MWCETHKWVHEDGWKRTYGYTEGRRDANGKRGCVHGVVVLVLDDDLGWGWGWSWSKGRSAVEGRRRRFAVYVRVVAYVGVPGVAGWRAC